MGEKQRARAVGRGAEVPGPFWVCHPPGTSTIISLEALQPCRFEFLWKLHYGRHRLNHWPLEMNSTSSPSLLSGGQGGAGSSSPLITWSVPLATDPHPVVVLGLSKPHLIHMNSGVAERGWSSPRLSPSCS